MGKSWESAQRDHGDLQSRDRRKRSWFTRVSWRQFAGCMLAAAACATLLRFPGLSQSPPAAIRFEYQAIPFVLENSVTPAKHLPETMPGGIAVFDFDNDGYPDIFFANGAEMPGLQKSSAKVSNRLFHN